MKSVKAIVGDRPTVTVGPLSSVTDAARLMAAHQVGGLPVVEGDRLVGIFTERDVLTRVVAAGRAPDDTRVTDVMSSDLVVAEVVESCEDCLSRMQRSRVRHLIVLDRAGWPASCRCAICSRLISTTRPRPSRS